ncbi:MAG TPA: DGQHR domain-containing protein [Acidobacteriaceae bacterium]|nr:DGQHR domain-containing protein [Acidobacteriaceae bacterium]
MELTASRGKNLDTICYRGSAPLAQLALISQTDIFDQVTNPKGLQRDLSPKHASEAYEYVHRAKDNEYPRAFPEVVLNVRDRKVLEVIEDEAGASKLRFSIADMREGKVYVSRVDGNHRLFYAAGDDRREPLLSEVPFQLHIGLSQEQERSLFVDINSNQKGLSSSHLAVMQNRLTADEIEIRDHLDRWIASKLSKDPSSPWHGMIHEGGSKRGTRQQGLTRLVNFASIQGGVSKLLSKSQYIHDLGDAELQYLVIRNYWQAAKQTFSLEWATPKDFLLLKNIGVWSLSILGAAIIDRCMPQGKVAIDDFAYYLRQARARFDWSKEATGERAVAGMNGNKAALIIAGEMAKELTAEGGNNMIRDLQTNLRSQLPS